MSEFNDLIKTAIVEGGGQVHGETKVDDLGDDPIKAVTQKSTDAPKKEETKKEPEAKKETDVSDKGVDEGRRVFDISTFNEKFGKNFESEDALVDYIEKGGKYDDLLNELESVKSSAKVNPLDYFASTDDYVLQQFKKNKANQFSEEAFKALSKLSPSSIDKLNELEALKLDMLINNPELEGGESAIGDLLMDKYNVDDLDWESLDVKTKNLIRIDAKSAKGNLKGLFSDITVPEVVDTQLVTKQLKDTWSNPMTELVKGIDKIKLAEGMDFVVSDDMKQGLLEEAMEDVVRGQVKPTKETASQVAGALRTKILERNMDKVVEFMRSSLEEQIKDKYRQKVHNTEPLNNGVGSAETEKGVSDAIGWLLR